MEYIITFKSTHLAMKAEQYLLDEKLTFIMIPLPSQISAGCGICVKASSDGIEKALKTLKDKQVDGTALFSRIMENGRYVYTQMEGEFMF